MSKIRWSCFMTSNFFELLKDGLAPEIEKHQKPYEDEHEATRAAGQKFWDRTVSRLQQFRDNLTYQDGRAESWIDLSKVPHPFQDVPGEVSPMTVHLDHFAGDIREIALSGMLREMRNLRDPNKFEKYKDLLDFLDEEAVFRSED